MTSAEPLWEVRRHADGETVERLPIDRLRLLITKGLLTAEDYARRPTGGAWRQIGTIDELAGSLSGSRSRSGRRRQPAEEEDFDMTPMIDVTFLLLIFFMVTASFNYQKGLDFPASSETAEETSSQDQAPGFEEFDDRILVGIDRQDRFSFRDGRNPLAPGEPIAADELTRRLDLKSRDEHKSKLLIVTDDLSSHDAVVRLIDAASSVGIKEIGMANVIDQSNLNVGPAP